MLWVLEHAQYIFTTESQHCWILLLKVYRMRMTLLLLNYWATCPRHSLISQWVRTLPPRGSCGWPTNRPRSLISQSPSCSNSWAISRSWPGRRAWPGFFQLFNRNCHLADQSEYSCSGVCDWQRGIYKTPGIVKRTRYGWIIKPADCFPMMVSRCPVPSPLSTLDVLGLPIMPTTFSAILFTGEDGVGRILKRTQRPPVDQVVAEEPRLPESEWTEEAWTPDPHPCCQKWR